jgi:hypothetical protein
VQGGGDMGAIPNKLPGFGDILDDEVSRTGTKRPGPTGYAGKYLEERLAYL